MKAVTFSLGFVPTIIAAVALAAVWAFAWAMDVLATPDEVYDDPERQRPMLLVAVVGSVLVLLFVVAVGRHHGEAPAPRPPAIVTAAAADPALAMPVAPPTTAAVTTTTTATAARRISISSTMYCETGRMANGEFAHDGAVSSKVLRRGSRWRVLTGRFAGRVFTVEDTGSLAIFDIAAPGRCPEAIVYGRHTITIEAA